MMSQMQTFYKYGILHQIIMSVKKVVMLHAWKSLLVSDLITTSGFHLYFPEIWLLHKASTLKD